MDQKILLFTLLSLVISPLHAQNHNIVCNFQFSAGNYDCNVNTAVVPDTETLNFVFIGTHQTNQNDQTVTRVVIQGSFMPFIIRQAIVQFPILRVYSFINAVPTNVKRIQANAFQNSPGLLQISITNAGLNNIAATGLQGAINLQLLELQGNRLTSIPQGTLNSLVNLLAVDLSSNLITEIHPSLFQNIPTLLGIKLNNNQLTRLSDMQLSRNPQLNTFLAQNNQIDAIDRRFLIGLNSLMELNLFGNLCVSMQWNNINLLPNLDPIHAALQTCYSNYGGGAAEIRSFRMNLRGALTLFREDGTLVGRL